VVMPMVVVVRMVFGGGSALTGRVGRPSTPGLAVVAAASLAVAPALWTLATCAGFLISPNSLITTPGRQRQGAHRIRPDNVRAGEGIAELAALRRIDVRDIRWGLRPPGGTWMAPSEVSPERGG
jgi:hypothetical protein